MSMMEGTTIVAVRRDGKCAMAGDGQVTFGEKTIMKHGAVKVRRLYKGQVVVGFAGSVADAFTLSERFEAKLEQYGGSLSRAAVELAQAGKLVKGQDLVPVYHRLSQAERERLERERQGR